MTEQENKTSFFKFDDLRVYAKAIDYVSWVQQVLNNFPKDQDIMLTKNFANAAQHIALHIAEGSARNKAQFVYFLKMAKGSVRECVVFTEIAENLSFLTSSEAQYSIGQLMELTKMIGKLAATLQESILVADRRDESERLVELL